ncbi:MAG: M18 family aminopeptidase [Christensenellaceae bacterium]
MELTEFLSSSYTAFQAVENAERILSEQGFEKLSEREAWKIARGGKYFVERAGSSLVAFCVGDGEYYKLIASHTDSPLLKLKEHPQMETDGLGKWNVESYGGGVWQSFFDRPMRVAGRIVTREGNKLIAKNVVSPYRVVIPALAIHMNHAVNDGVPVNPQIDLLPLCGIGSQDPLKAITTEEVVSYDLFVAPDVPPFVSGVNGEFLSAPRLDNLTSVLASIEALTHTDFPGICVAAILDNEEIGSKTRQGAGSDFLEKTLSRISASLGFDYASAIARSILISLDNSHSVHPNHPEKCDPTNRPVLGGGIVVKSHANKAYTTEALSSAIVKGIFERAGVKYQTFFNRSDMRSGGTLGAISLSQVGVLTVDLGLAELAMHSATETFAPSDYEELKRGLAAYYRSDIRIGENTAEF